MVAPPATPHDGRRLEGSALDTTARLRIASHIHFALLRHYGEDVSVGTLLRGGEAAREALWVCEASDDAELAQLGRQLSGLLAADAATHRRALKAAAPQDAVWAADTSGFGVTRPSDERTVPAPARPSGWLAAAVGWGRRGGPRSPR